MKPIEVWAVLITLPSEQNTSPNYAVICDWVVTALQEKRIALLPGAVDHDEAGVQFIFAC